MDSIRIKQKLSGFNPVYLSVFLFLFFLVISIPVYNRIVVDGDLAEYLNNALRILHGEMPYRDFWLIGNPGEMLVPTFFYKVFSLSANVLLVQICFTAALLSFFSFWIARLMTEDNFYSMLAALLIFFSGKFFGMEYLFLTLSALFFARYLKMANISQIFLSGIFIGVAFLFRFYEVNAFLLAVVLTTFYFLKDPLQVKALRWRPFYFLFLGLFISLGLCFVPLISIWRPMIQQIILDNIKVVASHGASMHLPYFVYHIPDFLHFFEHINKALTNPNLSLIKMLIHDFFNLCNVVGVHLLPLLIGILFVGILMNKRIKINRSEKSLILFFLLWGFFGFLKVLGRADMGTISRATAPWLFMVVFLFQKSWRFFWSQKTFLNKFVLFAVVGIGILLLARAPLYFIDTYHLLSKARYKVSAPYGTLYHLYEDEALNINRVIDFIEEKTKEGDAIFVTSWYAPPFYALTNRRNPTYYDSLIDLVARPSEEKQMRICRELSANDTKLIVHCRDWGLFEKEELLFSRTCPVLQNFIEQNFDCVKKFGNYWIYTPKHHIAQ